MGMVLGLALGLALNLAEAEGPIRTYVVAGFFRAGGEIFLASLKLLVVPLVFVSLVCGTAALEDVTRLGRVGGKTLTLYLATTAIAITLALTAAVLVEPGAGFNLTTDASFQPVEAPSLRDTIVGLFPSNPIRAMAEGNMLQIIVFSGLFGLALTVAGAAGQAPARAIQRSQRGDHELVMLLMQFAPYGVFCPDRQGLRRAGLRRHRAPGLVLLAWSSACCCCTRSSPIRCC